MKGRGDLPPLSPCRGLPCVAPRLVGRPGNPTGSSPGSRLATLPGMATRRLIAAALVCGLVILVAFTVQVALAAR